MKELCRLCLNKKSKMISIYQNERNTARDIYLITGVVVSIKIEKFY